MAGRAAQKHFLYLELAKFLRAGVGVQKAVESLLKGRIPEFQREVLRAIEGGLNRGESVSMVFESLAPKISALESVLVHAGEKSGTLGAALGHLGEYFGMVANLEKQVFRGLIYPAALVHLAVFSRTVPEVFGARGGGFFDNCTTLMGPLWYVYIGVVLLFFAVRSLLAMASTDAGVDRILHRVPWVGSARIHLAMGRFCLVYHGCLLAGIAVSDTLRAALDAAGSGVLHGASARLFDALKRGDLLGPAFISEPVFPRVFSLVYSNGETAGTLDTDMHRLGEQFQAEAKQSLQDAGAAFPKIITFSVMAYAIYKVVSFYTVYLSAMRGAFE
jgi:type II secretory pathway component PulF